MTVHRWVTPVACVLVFTLRAVVGLSLPADQAPAALETGRHDVLLDLHGFNHRGAVVVALPPLVHWLGATVDDVEGWTVVSRDENSIYLQLPEERQDGLGTLVGLREVVEGLGAEVTYHGADSQAAEVLGYIPHVEMIDGDRTARVLLHATPPGIVQSILEAVDREDLMTSFLVHVSAIHDGWAKTHEPRWDEQFGFSQFWGTGVLQRVERRWQYVMRTTRISHTRAELADAGIPLEVAGALGMEIED